MRISRRRGDVEVSALHRDGVVALARAHADFNRYLVSAVLRYSSPREPGPD